jgi:hypothetical protein
MRKLVIVVVLALVGTFGASASANEGDTGHDRACQNPGASVHNPHCDGYEGSHPKSDSGADDEATPPEDRVPQDTDGDDVPDDYNWDNDGDGVPNWRDNCPTRFNDDQTNTDAADEGLEPRGDACDGDNDNDGDLDGADNCDVDANADQADLDGDGRGDACDDDDDADSVADSDDNCPTVKNKAQDDADHDGTGDACDESGNKTIGDQVSEAAKAASGAALDEVDGVLSQLP